MQLHKSPTLVCLFACCGDRNGREGRSLYFIVLLILSMNQLLLCMCCFLLCAALLARCFFLLAAATCLAVCFVWTTATADASLISCGRTVF
jgi:uncharacterized membrane protein YhaH (DUF805 family)